jgi:putative ABC transport system substrate-binding protein
MGSPRTAAYTAAVSLQLLFGDGVAAQRAQIAVVLERDAKIYRLTLDRFRQLAQQEAAPIEITPYILGGEPVDAARVRREIRGRRPALVFAIGPNAAVVSSEELPDVPIVYGMVVNPARYPLQRPNICGISLDISPSEQFDLLKQIKPDAKRVAVIYNPNESGKLIEEAWSLAKARNLDLLRKQAHTVQEAIASIRELESEKLDAFLMVLDPVIANETSFRILLTFSLKNLVPLVVPADPFVQAGALFSIGPDYSRIGDQAWKIAKQILQGHVTPAEVGTRKPEAKIIAVNGTIARSLRLDIPRDLKIDIVY